MIGPLTAEQICELDTFTLEQKIDELQSHPNKQLFSNIIKIAKLQLIDRLEIEQFGRLLANDEYKFDFDFKPPLISQPKQHIISNIPSGTINRKQIAAKMQNNLVTGGSYVVIGKPPVNHRYKPKIKKIEPVQKTKRNFLKAKKQSISLPKAVMARPLIKQAKQVMNIATKEQSQHIEKKIKQKAFQSNEHIPVIIQQLKQEISLKQRLKKQVKEMNIVYCQNDAYDDMLGVTIKPLNLKEEQNKILSQGSETSLLQTYGQLKYEKAQEQQQPIQEDIQAETKQTNFNTFIQQPTARLVNRKRSQQIQEKMQRSSHSPKKFIVQGLRSVIGACEDQHFQVPKQTWFIGREQSINALNFKQNDNVAPFQPKFTSKQSAPIIQDKIKLIAIDFKATKQSPNNKETKSKSVKNFQKRVIQNVKSQLESFQLLTNQYPAKFVPQHHKSASIKILNEKGKPKKQYQKPLISDNRNLLRSTATKFQQNIYPYHQIIVNFQKLFPHSKNLLVTLRNVEQNLKLHFDKDLNNKSKNNDFVRLNEKQLIFKLVTQSQKAKRHEKLFNITLDSFHKRNSIMLNRINNQLEPPLQSQMLFYRVVRTKEEVYDIINSSFHRTDVWFQLPHGMELKNSWNLLWTWSKPQIDFQDLIYFQKVNHFIGNKQIARKDLLKKNIQKIQKLSNKMKNYFDIIPQTFLLPGQNIAFIKKFRQYSLKDPLNYWILKPVGLSRGRGISLINKLEQVVFSEPIVLQKYIMNPLLVDGYKFDMRIYVLVSSINPLQAFVYNQGFARLSTQRYSLSQDMMDNKFVHLTNFSIQRENLAGQRKQTFQEEIGGSKITLKMLAERLKLMGVQWGIIERQIEDIILKSLIACMNTIPQNPNCFELFGYDIFIDSDSKCWLLEVNSSPSLQKQYTLDQIIKQQLVDDIVEIVQPMNYDRKRLLQVVERRRREAEGLKSSINTNNNSQQQLDQDLSYILHGKSLRKYGTLADHRNFKLIAPSQKYFQIIKTLQQYKIDPIIKNEI